MISLASIWQSRLRMLRGDNIHDYVSNSYSTQLDQLKHLEYSISYHSYQIGLCIVLHPCPSARVQDGEFLVRQSAGHGSAQPYALSVVSDGAIHHVGVRRTLAGRFALGSEKPGEPVRN